MKLGFPGMSLFLKARRKITAHFILPVNAILLHIDTDLIVSLQLKHK